MHEDSLTKAFVRDARRADVEGHPLHSLRHAFVTRLFREGVGAPTVQRLAGHEHLVTTQRYAHATADRPPGRRRATRGFTNGNVRGNRTVTARGIGYSASVSAPRKQRGVEVLEEWPSGRRQRF